MGVTLGQLATLVGGKLTGDEHLPITAARPLGEADAGAITFLEHFRHAHILADCKAAAAVGICSGLLCLVNLVLQSHCECDAATHESHESHKADQTQRRGGGPHVQRAYHKRGVFAQPAEHAPPR